MNTDMKAITLTCKFCKAPLEERFIDIVLPEGANQSKEEGFTNSLATYICSECFLVQNEDSAILASQEQLYVSSFSSSWLNDMNQYIGSIFKKFELTDQNLLVELAGHQELLGVQHTLPFGNKGLHALIEMHGKADTLICNDALAYVNDINDFVSAIKIFLKPSGIAILEFLHLLPLMESNQFEVQIIDGNVPYFSFTTIDKIFKHHGLVIFDTEVCSGKGCIRVYAKHQENSLNPTTSNTRALRGRERDKGMSYLSHYTHFRTQHNLQTQLLEK